MSKMGQRRSIQPKISNEVIRTMDRNQAPTELEYKADKFIRDRQKLLKYLTQQSKTREQMESTIQISRES